MFTSVFLNVVYLLFPLAVYFLYLVYSKATYEKEKLIFFDLALFTSYYLCSKFGELSLVSSFLINIPLVLALYKKRLIPSVFLSIATSLFLSGMYNVSIYAYFVNYFVIMLLVYVTKFKVVNIIVANKIIFDAVVMSLSPHLFLNVKMIAYFVLFLVVMYVVYYFIILFYSKVETIVKMYHSLEEITKEKTLYQSLFKITHEIKNPLAVCKGYLEMFDIKNASKANKYVGVISQEIDRTLVLLNDFSNVSKLNIETSEMDVTMLLEDVCDESMMIFKNNTHFDYLIDDEEVYINGDYNRLKQVFINVIKNAKEAIGDSGIVRLDAKRFKNVYIITVRDDGIGMDKKTIKKIGTPFYTTKKAGTGLGVCFSREILEKHGGSMEYISKLGKGTTTRVVLPIYKTTTIN